MKKAIMLMILAALVLSSTAAFAEGSGVSKVEIIIENRERVDTVINENHRYVMGYAAVALGPTFLRNDWDRWDVGELNFGNLTDDEKAYLDTITHLSPETWYYIDLSSRTVQTHDFLPYSIEEVTGTEEYYTYEELDPLTILITHTIITVKSKANPYTFAIPEADLILIANFQKTEPLSWYDTEPAPSVPVEELVQDQELPAVVKEPDPSAVAKEKNVIVLVIGSKIALVNGEEVMMDVAPFVKPQVYRTMIPVRFVGEQLGARVSWLPENRQVRIVYGRTESILTVGSARALAGGQELGVESPLEILDGRTFVPLRFVSETLGGTVHWDGATQTITIKK